MAVAYDAAERSVQLYVDGAPVERHSLRTAVPARLQEISLGAPTAESAAAWPTTMRLCGAPERDSQWVHAAVVARDNLPSDERADGALRLCTHKVERRTEDWILLPVGDGTYHIALSSASRCELLGSFLCAFEASGQDRRDESSTWVTLAQHDEQHQQCCWRVVPSGGVNQYHIQLAGPRGAALPSDAWLHAAEGGDCDRRDDESSYLCVHDSERSVWQLNPCLPWQSALPDNQHGSHSPLQGQLPFPEL